MDENKHTIRPADLALWFLAGVIAVALTLVAPRLGAGVTGILLVTIIVFLIHPILQLPFIRKVSSRRAKLRRFAVAMGIVIVATVICGFYVWPEPDRAHISITSCEFPYPLSTERQPAINILFRNHGLVGADLYGRYESFLRDIPTEEAQKIKLEDELFTRMRDSTRIFLKVLNYQIPPDVERYTTDFGPYLTEDDLQNINHGNLALYVMGTLQYRDTAGCREINYCVYTQGRAIFSCHHHNDEMMSCERN